MKKLQFLLLLTLVTIFFACSNDGANDLSVQLDDYSNTPVFSFTANEGEYLIQAGVDDYYMFTEYELDTTETFSFTGRFEKLPECSIDCLESLSFTLSLAGPIQEPNSSILNEVLSTQDFDIENNSTGPLTPSVLIEYRNPDGITFRSDLIENLESTFELLSVEDYNRNENDDLTKLLRIAFEVELKSTESEDFIFFQNAEAVIAIAYPG